MDLNLDNYSLIELINILQVPKKDINITILQKCLYDKIDQVKAINLEDLPENKEHLIEFYTKGFFKLLKNITNLNTTEKDSTIIPSYERAIGNIYTSSEEDSNDKSIGVKEKILPPLTYNTTVQENNSFIIPHKDQNSVNTFNSNLKQGIINPLTRKSFTKILNINTKFRNNYTTTSSTNYSIDLPSTIKKVVSMKLLNCQFPEVVYTVSPLLGSNSFIINDIPIDISKGNYTSTTITNTINKVLNDNGINVTLLYNDVDGTMTFKDNSGSDLSLNFNYNNESCPQLPSNIYKDQLTLGWLLGFRGNYIHKIKSSTSPYMCLNKIKNQEDISFAYTGSSSYTGESLFDLQGSKYLFISINDFQNNHNNIFISPFQYQSLADNNIIAKITTECNKCSMEQPERIYFGPTDIAKLHIIIYDEFGRIIDINNADYSLTLELQIIYDL